MGAKRQDCCHGDSSETQGHSERRLLILCVCVCVCEASFIVTLELQKQKQTNHLFIHFLNK